MGTSLARSLFSQQLRYEMQKSSEQIKFGKKNTLSQNITNLYAISSCRSKIANLQNDSNYLTKSKNLISMSVANTKTLDEKLNNLKKIASQIGSSDKGDAMLTTLTNSFRTALKDYDSQAEVLGFNGTKSGAPKITTSGSNEYSLIDASNLNPLAGAGGVFF